MAAMFIHSAGESFKEPPKTRGSPIYAVALAAKNEEQLLRLERKLQASGIPHQAIREPDAPFNGELLAIGIQPIDRDRVKKLTKKFPLAG